MLDQGEIIPSGWSLASIQDVTEHQEEAHKAIRIMNMDWAICTLVDGKISGPGYNFVVEKGSFFDLGHKLIINKEPGK